MLITEAVGDLRLQPEGEHVAGALLHVMQLGADAKKEVVGAVQLLALGRCEQLRVDECLRGGQAAFDPAAPEQVLVITQAAAAVLDVGLLQKRRLAGLLMPLALVGHAPREILLVMTVQAAALKGLLVFGPELFVSGQEARLEQ